MAVNVNTPKQGEWTYDDLLRLPDDGKRYEIIEGVLIEMPSPMVGHQRIIGKLHTRFELAAEKIGAMVFLSPLDVLLTTNGSVTVEPDLFVVTKERVQELGLHDPDARKAVGAPDLVVEVLSPSTSSYDRNTKREQYEKAGVKEYWTVSREMESIEILVHRNGRYERYILATVDDVVTSTILPDLSFKASEIFRG